MMGRPVSDKRYIGDKIMVEMLSTGEKRSIDVIKKFEEAGLSRADYRASRHRLGAVVRSTGGYGISYWCVSFPDNKPSEPGLCSPRRVDRSPLDDGERERLKETISRLRGQLIKKVYKEGSKG